MDIDMVQRRKRKCYKALNMLSEHSFNHIKVGRTAQFFSTCPFEFPNYVTVDGWVNYVILGLLHFYFCSNGALK